MLRNLPRTTTEKHDNQETTNPGSQEPQSQAMPSSVEPPPQTIPVPDPPSTGQSENTEIVSPNTKQESTQIAILMDSNGKYMDWKKLFPQHTVLHIKCQDTKRAMELLTEDELGCPSHIIIHTGTHNLKPYREHNLVQSIKEVIGKDACCHAQHVRHLIINNPFYLAILCFHTS